MGQMVYLKDVVTLDLDAAKCTGCGLCIQVCPHTVFIKNNGKVSIDDRDKCMECGACAINCPAEAIFVKSGVGCAAAVINSVLGRTNSSCCCVVEDEDEKGGKECSTSTCC